MVVKALIMGIIQGLSEFIPISSSGHLKLARFYFNFETANNHAFDVAVHFATLLAVIIVFWADLKKLIGGLVKSAPSILNDPKAEYKTNKDFRMAVLIVIATIPAVVFGLVYKLNDFGEQVNVNMVSVNLILTGFILLATFFKEKKNEPVKDFMKLGIGFAIAVGAAQAAAVFPGISRSGATISAALLLGGARAFAGTFSFLLSIPAILGAAVLEAKDISSLDLPVLAAGFSGAFIAGFTSLKLLLAFVKNGKLYYFAFYCLAAGTASLVYLKYFYEG